MSNIIVEGRDKVGSLVGMANVSAFNRISLTNIYVYGNLYYAGGLKNIYEARNSTGISNIDEGNDIKLLEDTMLQDENFYKNTLNWSDSIWDFSRVSSGEAPKIK